MDLDDVRLLRSDAAAALLAGLPDYREQDALQLATGLRADGHDPRLVGLVLTQARLRAGTGERLEP